MVRLRGIRGKLSLVFLLLSLGPVLSSCDSHNGSEDRDVNINGEVVGMLMHLQGETIGSEVESVVRIFDPSGYPVGGNGYPIVPYLDIQDHCDTFSGLLNTELDVITVSPNGFYLSGVMVENVDLGDLDRLCSKLEELGKACEFNDCNGGASTADEFRQLILRGTGTGEAAVLEFSTLHAREWYRESDRSGFPRALRLCVYCVGDMLTETDVVLTGCSNYDETDALLIFDDARVNIINSTIRCEVDGEIRDRVTVFQWSVGGG